MLEKPTKTRTLFQKNNPTMSDSVSLSEEEIEKIENIPKKRKKNLFSNAKRGFASKAASSKAGGSLINRALDKETKDMIHAIRDITLKESGSEAAKLVKKDIFKIAVKLILLYQDKVITKQDFIRVRGEFKRVCSSLRNGYRTGVLESETAYRIVGHVGVFLESVQGLLEGRIKEDTMERVVRIGNTLGDYEWLIVAQAYNEEFGRIVLACGHYLDQLR